MDANGTVAPSQVIINGQEYDPAEAQGLIELGNKYRDLESKWNTSLDKVVPEYTKATQTAKQLEAQLAEQTKALEEYRQKAQEAETPTEKKKALEMARDLGLADKEWMKQEGFMTQKSLDSYLDRKFQMQQATNTLLSQADKMEKEIDGSDGRVPFIKDAVLAYAAQMNKSDLTEAYNEMTARHNAKWQEAQIAKAKTAGLKTLKGGGQKLPPDPGRTTDDNVRDRLREALWGANE